MHERTAVTCTVQRVKLMSPLVFSAVFDPCWCKP